MIYNGYNYWGLDLVWWFIWLSLLFWIFATPYNIPFQRMKKDTPLYILKKRYASGQITIEEYEEKKKIILKEPDQFI